MNAGSARARHVPYLLARRETEEFGVRSSDRDAVSDEAGPDYRDVEATHRHGACCVCRVGEE
ncbi:hypothetical protein [Panacagrimonas perspica]|uniref:hypothetical protein n=1 Tax=Panacagrimonas perspica TaxID=381431 RepID=UPI00105F19EB|nr:hypothetical protein [Panacagrimonas perspica]